MKKTIICSHGTGMQMEEAMKARLAELTTSDDSITSAQDVDPTHDERYIHSLVGDLDTLLSDQGFTDVNYDTDDSALYVEITDGGDVTTYEIPFDDLSFDFDTIDNDIDYITNSFMHGGVEED